MEKNKIRGLVDGYKKEFNDEPVFYVTAGGRLEIIGNHTDHNHGLCIVGNCSLRICAVIKQNSDKMVKILSKGHEYFEFDLEDLSVKTSEYSTTKGMVRGILAKIKELGYKIGGFNAYIESDIPEGSGVSSSAAFEVLIGEIVNYLYNDNKISHLEIAKIGQYSEQNYFHKPCGLLDQIGAAFKDCNFLDFKNIKDPEITGLDFNLPVDLFLINSVGDHSNLTHLYAEIPDGMRKVANMLGENYLRDTKEEDFIELVKHNKIEDPKAIKKAKHFYQENKNVLQARDAIINNNTYEFFKAIKASQDSSNLFLENTYVRGDEYLDSPQDIIDKVNNIPSFSEMGAIRIHGGGFKGSVLAFVKHEFRDEFVKFLNNNYASRYREVSISKEGVTKELIN